MLTTFRNLLIGIKLHSRNIKREYDQLKVPILKEMKTLKEKEFTENPEGKEDAERKEPEH